MSEHKVIRATFGQVVCACGAKFMALAGDTIAPAVQSFAEHYAVEEQAKKPRARRGGVDDSEPTSASHKRVLNVLGNARVLFLKMSWFTASEIYDLTDYDGGKVYSPQRIRTCLAGLVRAGLVEERKVGKHREYRLVVK